MKDKAGEIKDKTRKEIIGTIKTLESSADGSVKWQALSDLARFLDSGAEIPAGPSDGFGMDTEGGKWLLDYLQGAADYGALQYPDVRQAIAREIVIYMEEYGNG